MLHGTMKVTLNTMPSPIYNKLAPGECSMELLFIVPVCTVCVCVCVCSVDRFMSLILFPS